MTFFEGNRVSLKAERKVCDAIQGTLYVASEGNAAINKNNRFTERFNFELAFNLPSSKLFLKSVSIGNTGATGRVTLFLATGMPRFFAKLGLNSRSCRLLKSFARRFVSIFLIDWGPSKCRRESICEILNYSAWLKFALFYPHNFER